jgi:hypothetical protein
MSNESDFHLIPIEKQNNPNWQWRVATWPVQQVDPHVHELFDGTRLDPIKYQRVRIHDGKLENCIVMHDGQNIIMKPGNGFDYLVKRINHNNKPSNHHDINQDVPHNMVCDVCLTNKKTHVMLDCNHVCICEPCSIAIYNTTKQCPICKTSMTKPALKLLFT